MDTKKPFRISRRTVEALRPAIDGTPHGRCFTDATLKNFFVACYSSGVINFGLRYTARGLRRTVFIGKWPSTDCESARRVALSILGAAARDEDELEKRQKARGEAAGLKNRICFKSWRETYVAEAARRLRSVREVARYSALNLCLALIACARPTLRANYPAWLSLAQAPQGMSRTPPCASRV